MFQMHQPNIENLNQYLKEEKEKNNRTEGPSWWSIPAGMSSIRILPPWDPTGRVALPVYMHPIEYQEEGMKYKKYNWTCVNRTFGKRCKICEALQEMVDAGVDVSEYEANRRNFYMNAIVMYDPVYDQGIKSGKKPEDVGGVAPGTHVLMRAPKTLYDWVISQITNPMIGDITSVTNGIDVYVTKEGTGLGTKYTPTLSPNGRTAIPQEYLDKIEALYNLDDIFSVGFDDEQVDKLANHLKKSAGILSNQVAHTVNQMAGYEQAATVQPPVYQAPTGIPNPVPPQVPAMPAYQQAAPSPYTMNNSNADTTPPWVAPSQSAPVPPKAPDNNKYPKCYGNYDAGQVNCVVCPFEVQCSQKR